VPQLLSLPLSSFPLPRSDPWVALRAEAERNLKRQAHLPPMLIGYTQRCRLAVARPDLSPADLARAEQRLLARSQVLWTAYCGEAVIPTPGGGGLRHVFVRRRYDDGRWEAVVRPLIYWTGGLTWLGPWRSTGGELPVGLPFFPAPSARPIRFVRRAK